MYLTSILSLNDDSSYKNNSELLSLYENIISNDNISSTIKEESKKFMSSTSLFKFFFLFLLFPIISCQSVERVIDQNFNNEQKIQEIKDIEKVDNIFLGSSIPLNNFEKVIYLSRVKHSKNSNSKLKTFFFDDKFYTLNSNSELFINNSSDGELINNYYLLENTDDDNLVSNFMFNNYFVLGYSSGKIMKVGLDGTIIWSFDNKKIFNSFFIPN